MIEKYNRLSLMFIIPAFVLQVLGFLLENVYGSHSVWVLLPPIGAFLLLIGFAFYAKSKGLHWSWCFLALLSFIGFFLLFCLKDNTEIDQIERKSLE